MEYILFLIPTGDQLQPNIRFISGTVDRQVNIKDVVKPEVDPLEADLASMRTAEKPGISAHVSTAARPLPPSPVQDDMDIMLLYGLIRAVEYEANAKLFDKILRDLEETETLTDDVIDNDVMRADDMMRSKVAAKQFTDNVGSDVISAYETAPPSNVVVNQPMMPAASPGAASFQNTEVGRVFPGNADVNAKPASSQYSSLIKSVNIKTEPAPHALQQSSYNTLPMKNVPISRIVAPPVPILKRTEKVRMRM